MPHAQDEVRLANVRFTANFALNLERIEVFWNESGFAEAYDRLLDALTDMVVPNLERHPGMGRPFLQRTVDSVEAERIAERIASRLSALARDAQVREYVMDDYLVLYAHLRDHDLPGVVHLLAIKHQKQLGFDFPSESADGR